LPRGRTDPALSQEGTGNNGWRAAKFPARRRRGGGRDGVAPIGGRVLGKPLCPALYRGLYG